MISWVTWRGFNFKLEREREREREQSGLGEKFALQLCFLENTSHIFWNFSWKMTQVTKGIILTRDWVTVKKYFVVNSLLRSLQFVQSPCSITEFKIALKIVVIDVITKCTITNSCLHVLLLTVFGCIGSYVVLIITIFHQRNRKSYRL